MRVCGCVRWAFVTRRRQRCVLLLFFGALFCVVYICAFCAVAAAVRHMEKYGGGCHRHRLRPTPDAPAGPATHHCSHSLPPLFTPRSGLGSCFPSSTPLAYRVRGTGRSPAALLSTARGALFICCVAVALEVGGVPSSSKRRRSRALHRAVQTRTAASLSSRPALDPCSLTSACPCSAFFTRSPVGEGRRGVGIHTRVRWQRCPPPQCTRGTRRPLGI